MNTPLYIHQVTVLTSGQLFPDTAVLLQNGRIHTIAPVAHFPPPDNAQQLNGQGGFLLPGFIDLQCNGAFGLDFTANPNTIWQVATQLPQFGVTTFLPTLITSPLTTIATAQQTLAAGPPIGLSQQRFSQPIGLHLEGPFLQPSRKGAHPAAYLQPPSLTAVADWSPDTQVRLVTIAPELPGALPVIQRLAKQGVVVSAGHSAATFAETQAGIAAGIRYGTHLFNAMNPLHHREPGIIGALWEHSAMIVGVIPDGVHIHPALIKLLWQGVGNGRLNLVTDAMAALGMPAGIYQLGAQTVTVDSRQAQLADGTLAGSILSLDQALRNFMAFTGCTLLEAIPTITAVPATLLGLKKGVIAPGYDADLVLLKADLQVAATIIAGKIVYATTPQNGKEQIHL